MKVPPLYQAPTPLISLRCYGHGEEGGALITIQGHKNSVAVASLIGLNTIILCNGRLPADDMVEAAEEESIAILVSQENQFTVSYKLAALLGLCN